MLITVFVGCIVGGTVYGVMENKNKETSKTAKDGSLTNEIYHTSKASNRSTVVKFIISTYRFFSVCLIIGKKAGSL